MNLTTSFEIIVPVQFSPESVEDAVLDSVFILRPISRTPRLVGRPLLDERTTPLLGCYELRQNRRRELGLYGNEGNVYTLVKENTSFRLRKIRLWLFRCGIGFITLRAETETMAEKEIQDLMVGLCAIRMSRKIGFWQSVDRHTRTEQTFTFKDLLKKLFALLGVDVLRPIDGETFYKAHCLFYGVGPAEDPQMIFSFLEILRNQQKSTCIMPGYDEKYFYLPYTYITWAASERVLAAVGDLNTCGENGYFLTGADGLPASVFADYLLIYLNMIAANLKLQLLCKKYGLFDAAAVGTCPPEAVAALQEVLNTPIYGASNEPHINVLFDRYLADTTLGLPQKFGMLSDAVLKRQLREPVDVYTDYGRERHPMRMTAEDDMLISDILRGCEKIQTNVSYRDVHEDVRNRGIRDILDQKNACYSVHDQSQQGESGRGQGPGELDILFRRQDRSQWTIFEGLNIERGFGDRKNWEDHLFKLLFRYDKKGNKFLILAAYTECRPEAWGTIWDKYYAHISSWCPVREIQKGQKTERVCYQVVKDSCTPYVPEGYLAGNNMKIARCTYEIGNQQTKVIHIFIRLDSLRWIAPGNEESGV